MKECVTTDFSQFLICPSTLKEPRRAIRNKRRGMLSATIVLLRNTARPQSAAQTQDLITSFKWEQMDHPPVQPRFGAKWFSPLPTPKEVPGRQAIWRRRWPERCSVEVANMAGGRILWAGYTKTCAPPTISASIMAANMWKNGLKNVESNNNKILYETLLVFLQRNSFFYSETVLTFRISLLLKWLLEPSTLPWPLGEI